MNVSWVMAKPVWSRVDAWLKAQAPAVWENLAPPATEESLAQLAATLGGPVPDALREAFCAHDGMVDEFGATFFTGFRLPQRWMGSAVWCSCRRAEEIFDRSRRVWGEYWPERGLPIADLSRGNGYLVMRRDEAVVFFDTEDATVTPVAPSFRGWCEALLADIEGGRVVLADFDNEAHGADEPGLFLLRD
ncbi:MAG: SMI1/KNR4 family protein [Myxococcota bacterium]